MAPAGSSVVLLLRTLALAATVLAIAGASILACGGGKPRPVDLPPPRQATTLGVGDRFELRIVGEDKLPTVFQVAPDGTVDLPYIHRVKVEGLEPQEVAATVRDKLIEGEIWTDPSVSVSVSEYNSKRIEVLGQVQKPGSFPLEPGMTLLRAISLAGGFNSLADEDNVTIRRRVEGGIKAATVSVDDIIDNRIPDVPLQAGDSINVDDRVF
jgi:polysaccharide biosynthesis/export protein VpsN